jgi:hypothetical protein
MSVPEREIDVASVNARLAEAAETGQPVEVILVVRGCVRPVRGTGGLRWRGIGRRLDARAAQRPPALSAAAGGRRRPGATPPAAGAHPPRRAPRALPPATAACCRPNGRGGRRWREKPRRRAVRHPAPPLLSGLP